MRERSMIVAGAFAVLMVSGSAASSSAQKGDALLPSSCGAVEACASLPIAPSAGDTLVYPMSAPVTPVYFYPPAVQTKLEACAPPAPPRLRFLDWWRAATWWGTLRDGRRAGLPSPFYLRSPMLTGFQAAREPVECTTATPRSARDVCAEVAVRASGGPEIRYDISLPQLGASSARSLAAIIAAELDRGHEVPLRTLERQEFVLRPGERHGVDVSPCRPE